MSLNEVDKFLDEWKKKDNCIDNSYIEYKEHPTPEDKYAEDYIFDKLEEVCEKCEDIKTYEITYIGGFNSPGYDLSCYCLSIIDMSGELITYPINFEC